MMLRQFWLLFVLPLFTVSLVAAQPDAIPIEYNVDVNARIDNGTFEHLYTFEGTAGEIIVIEMIRSERADFDPYLYLATMDNELLIQNDDFYNLNSRIIYRVPEDATYQIIATRNGGRFASGTGDFTLTLKRGENVREGVSLEGRVTDQDFPPSYIFAPDEAGEFTITYNHVRGDYHPAVRISRITDENAYVERIGDLDIAGMQTATVTLTLDDSAIYIVSLESSNYLYSSSGAFALYLLNIAPVNSEDQ